MGIRVGYSWHVSLCANHCDNYDHLFLFPRDSAPRYTVIGQWEGCEWLEKRPHLDVEERTPIDKEVRTIFSQILTPESVLLNQL